ncbi:sterol 26-hydroxylase, mitochondrial-like [Pleuronectes platessa]|uniref:sterol 26-hydroxylase, mitochondrial-like n=1 Tax=Pleuronectes platessa TaxID=8262 RepID=UPI00232A3ED6|nr:sterol 26-hydroxylase, mitochondrial-like [Pleuronectes platessa]
MNTHVVDSLLLLFIFTCIKTWTIEATKLTSLLGSEPTLAVTLTRHQSPCVNPTEEVLELQPISGRTLYPTKKYLLTHIICSKIEHRKIYGPLWKSELGPLTLVNMAQADLIEQVLRQDGKHPIRTDMPFLRLYQEMRNQAYGPLTEIGANWQRTRSILNPWMLIPKHCRSVNHFLKESHSHSH